MSSSSRLLRDFCGLVRVIQLFYMANVYIVYHSGYGHTKLQAEAVHRGAASVAGTRAEIRTTEEASANLGQSEISLRYPGFPGTPRQPEPNLQLNARTFGNHG